MANVKSKFKLIRDRYYLQKTTPSSSQRILLGFPADSGHVSFSNLTAEIFTVHVC